MGKAKDASKEDSQQPTTASSPAFEFALNDLDETLPAPWEWDLKRLAASIVIACRDNGEAVIEEPK